MDMQEFASSAFVTLADLRDDGPREEIISVVEIGKYDKSNLILESGDSLSLNKTNAGTLIRALGPDAEAWVGATVKLYVGQLKYNGSLPMLPQALEVMAVWDFHYRSSVVWDKPIAGTGYWFCYRHELLLIGTRSHVPAPAPVTQWPSVIVERRSAPSVKPAQVYVLIENYPNLPKIERFARNARAGWDCWGAESPTTQAAE
jgi:hypothetical protein